MAYRRQDLVSTAELADWFGISATEVRNLANEGILEKARKDDGSEMLGRFVLKSNVKRYIQALKAKKGAQSETAATLDELRRRKMAAQVERAELLLEVEKGNFHPAQLIAELYNSRVLACRDSGLSVPSKLSQVLADQTDVAKVFKILTEEMDAVFSKLGEFQSDEVIKESHRYLTEGEIVAEDEADHGE